MRALPVVGAGLLLAFALALASSTTSSAASNALLSGRVVDGSGNGLANVNVSLYQGASTCCTWLTAANTDSQGRYSINAPLGTYRVQFYPAASSAFVGRWWSATGTARLYDTASDILLTSDQTLSDVTLEGGSIVSGRVTDANGGRPVPDVNVSAYLTGGCCTWVNGTATDSNGSYSIRVPSGSAYRVQFYPAAATSYVAQWWNGGAGATDYANATNVSASADAPNTDAALATGRQIKGKITSDGTTGIAGATVTVYVGGNGATCCVWLGTATTDSTGSYTLRVPSGSYRFQYKGPAGSQYMAKWSNGTSRFEDAVDVQVNGDVNGRDFRLELGRQISGLVLDSSMQAIPRAGVNAYLANGVCCTWVAGAQANSSGFYTLIVPQGVYRLRFDGPPEQTYIAKWSGLGTRFEDAGDVNATGGNVAQDTVVLRAGYAITGHVTDANGRGVAGVGIGAQVGLNSDGTQATCCTFAGGTGTDPSGGYRLVVPAGTYRLNFHPRPESSLIQQWYGGASGSASRFETAANVTVPPAQTIDTSLVQGTTITGHVTAAGARPIADAFVSAFTGGASATCCTWLAGTKTDSAGAYSLVVPANASYRLQFGGPRNDNYMTVWYDTTQGGAARFDLGADVNVLAATLTVDQQLGTGRIVVGKVTSDGTTGIPNVNVAVFMGGNTAQCCTWLAGSQTQADGTYQVVVPPGRYRLSFWAPKDSSYRSAWFVGPGSPGIEDFDRAADVDLTGAGQTINITLGTGIRITGRVTTDGSTGIGGVGVTAMLGGGSGARCCVWIGGTGTDGSGNYSLVVPAGTYRIQFYPPPGTSYIQQWWTSGGGADRFEMAEDVMVTTSSLSGKDARLPTGVVITGRVTSNGVTGLPNIGVGAFLGGTSTACCTFVAGTNTDGDGRYRLTVLPGTYRIQFWPGRGSTYKGAWWSSSGGSVQFDAAADVSATTGASNLDLQLSTGFTISGKVTRDGASGIAGVGVSVVLGGNNQCCTWLNGTGTDPNGDYSIVVSPGTYRIQFYAPRGTAYLNRFYKNADGGAGDFWNGDDIVVNGNIVRNIRLPGGRTVSGVVRGASGPIPGVGVNAMSCQGTICRPAAWGSTDAGGAYQLALAPGDYKIQFNTPFGTPYVSQWYSNKATFDVADTVTVAGQDLTLTDVTLTAGARIAGVVIDPNGVGIPGVGVAAQTCTGFSCQWVGGSGTSPTGQFMVVVPPGTYKVRVDPPPGSPFIGQWYDGRTTPDAAASVTAGGAPLTIRLSRGSRISGRVTSGQGTPIANVDVSAQTCSGNQCFWSGGTRTAADGTYAIVVQNGTYKVQFHPPFATSYITQWYDGVQNSSTATDVVVSGGDVGNVNATLASGVVISGTVTDGANGIPNVGVSAFTCTGYDCSWVSGTGTRLDGTYSLSVPSGTYKLRADPPYGSALVAKWYGGGSTPDSGTPVVIAGAPVTASFSLVSGTKISGRVTSDGTAGIANVNVSAQTCSGNPLSCTSAAGTRTNADGSYTMVIVNATYRVRFDPPFGTSYTSQWFNGKTSAATADTIVVNGADVANVNATLGSGNVIRGRVKDGAGTGIAGVFAAAFTCSGNQCTWIAGNPTGPDGSYAIVVPPAHYKVQFNPPQTSAFMPQWYGGTPGPDGASDVDATTSPGATLTDTVLAAGVRVRGVVRADVGTALAGAHVNAMTGCTTRCTWVAGTNTAADGSFAIALPAGTYYLQFSGPFGSIYIAQWYNAKPDSRSADPVTVGGSDVTLADVRLDSGIRIRGTITGPTGLPVPNANVRTQCLDAGCSFGTGTNTGADGTYTLVVYPGRYAVSAQADGVDLPPRYYGGTTALGNATAVTVPMEATGIDIQLVAGFRITGAVKDGSGSGIAGVNVIASRCSAKSCAFVNATQSAGDGTYSLLVPAGTYKIHFTPQGGAPFIDRWFKAAGAVASADLGDGVTVGPAAALADTTLPGAVYIRGTVTGTTSGGVAPLAGVRVVALYTGCTTTCRSFTTTTAADGTYAVLVPKSTTYHVRFSPPSGTPLAYAWYAAGAAQGADDYATAGDVVVATADVTGKDVELPVGAPVLGNVRNGSQQGVANVTVIAVSSCTGGGEVCFIAGRATTDANGAYIFYVRHSRAYKLGFEAPDGSPYASQLYNAVYNSDPTQGTDLQVPQQVGAHVDATLAGWSPISGRVTDGNGMPVSGAEVDLIQCLNNVCTSVASGSTGFDGRYSIATPPLTGMWKIRFHAPGLGLADQYWQNVALAADATLVNASVPVTNINAVMTP